VDVHILSLSNYEEEGSKGRAKKIRVDVHGVARLWPILGGDLTRFFLGLGGLLGSIVEVNLGGPNGCGFAGTLDVNCVNKSLLWSFESSGRSSVGLLLDSDDI
jgi:hypothetical protein